jgi:hypothetical protein
MTSNDRCYDGIFEGSSWQPSGAHYNASIKALLFLSLRVRSSIVVFCDAIMQMDVMPSCTLYYFIILLCLTPDDFTRQGESTATQWVKMNI